ncbi:MAG: VWA domain-containing protein [Nitrospinota bacterium]|nr:VWA domain-containing protein [Nitrospinota bacterium]
MFASRPAPLENLKKKWMAQWPDALEAWSRFTKLTPPLLLTDTKAEKAEGLYGSFAMIRLDDHAVVISLRQVEELELQSFATEILAHEIGHHVYAPGDLRDNALLIARIRAGLPMYENQAGFVANLYTDLLINDRLQRSEELDMAGVYRKLKKNDAGSLWTLYMKIYENLWGLPPGTLADVAAKEKRLIVDAQLGARVIRAYSKDWLDGAGRFTALVAPYIMESGFAGRSAIFLPIMDTRDAGAGGGIPDGLVEIDPEELDGAIHPADDPAISGFDDTPGDDKAQSPEAGGEVIRGGKKNNYRSPAQYRELMKSVASSLKEDELIIRYYRERALPYLIPFPARETPRAADPIPEGLELWDVGQPAQELDWMESTIRSPVIIPGVTTYQRTYGTSEGSLPEKIPTDLYVGIDCSGSMTNPKFSLSYPALAGVIVAMSALRAGAKVMSCLSGEPGRFTQTEGFIRDEKRTLKLLTGYLGSGYSYGVKRLEETFLGKKEKPPRPVHLLIVTDQDIFHMLKEVKNGWEIITEALEKTGGGGTFVLNIYTPKSYAKDLQRMGEIGWDIHMVSSQEDMVEFARKFSRRMYDRKAARERGKG